MLPNGPLPSPPSRTGPFSPKSGCHISNWLSLLKVASSAPATAPVTINGDEEDDWSQANVAVREISLSFILPEDLVRGLIPSLV